MIIDEIKKILHINECTCYEFDEENLTIVHTIPIEEARFDDCDNRVFTQITGFLLQNNIDYEVSLGNDIQLKNLAVVPNLNLSFPN